ncbi:flagellar motor switch protein FliM, partial [Rhodobacter sphaeroides]|uniref:FliM/FliN family flagellar motor switch protein n=1 Tax=Cereibacter sphaeroides TaxID=1063 RepID=UPI0013657013
ARPAGGGARPHDGSQDEAPPPLTDFGAALAEQVMAVDCRLEAVLGRITLPLAQVLDWQPGDTVPLPQATLDHILFVGLDGHPVAEGRLGQHRGMRAVRLAPMAAADPPPALPEFEPEDEDLSFAMTGTDE